MSYKRKYSIFVSSTYEDLKEERQVVMNVALENDFIPVGMEQFHAAPASQWDIIKMMIDECDCYLLIIGGRYGSIDDTVSISYTEKEYNYAKEKNLPVLVLIRNTEFITVDKMDTSDETHDKYYKQRLLDAFRNRVKNDGNTVDFFDQVDDLKYKASQALVNAPKYRPEMIGWVRYSDILSIINEMVDEQNKHSTQLSEQQEGRLTSIEALLNDLTNEIKVVKETQLTWQDFKIATKEDIDKLFTVEGETLKID